MSVYEGIPSTMGEAEKQRRDEVKTLERMRKVVEKMADDARDIRDTILAIDRIDRVVKENAEGELFDLTLGEGHSMIRTINGEQLKIPDEMGQRMTHKLIDELQGWRAELIKEVVEFEERSIAPH